jgi:hypothetical protein
MTDGDFVASAMPIATINCPGTAVPEGSFPVSLKLGWHGGVHLHAPALGTITLPVRAIADGEVVFARKPTVQSMDAKHPQNYNPYGADTAWTDSGMVILRHVTDIGEGENAQSIVFYSIIMHLSELRGVALRKASGISPTGPQKVYRKEILGLAGRVYNAADHIHFEIACDDSNCRKLVGRTTGQVDLSENGRTDAIYGELYFYLPAGTSFYASKPHASMQCSDVATVYTSNVPLVVGLRHANGEGAACHRGDDYLATYLLDGSLLGDIVEEQNAEYEMYSRSMEIAESISAEKRPSPSAVYELLRFGRVVNTSHEHLEQGGCPHWRYVSYGEGKGWINLAASNVTKYSDADFPHWKFWSLIDDDADGDSRANSKLLTRIIGNASNANGDLSREELEKGLNIQQVRDRLCRSICKFPSEWNRDAIERRWEWLQSSAAYQLSGDDWMNFREHVAALAVPSADLPQALRDEHWHFHPIAFVAHFRKCQWLSGGEFRQLVPKHVMRTHAGTNFWEPVHTNLTHPASIAVSQRVALNKMARKYGISSPLRLASFFGNSIQETQWLGRLSEAGGDTLWYAPWYGRGFLQLTHPANYMDYWRYRGKAVSDALKTSLIEADASVERQPVSQRSNIGLRDQNFSLLTQKMKGWREEVRGVALDGSNDSTYAPADTAGFYWARLKMASYADSDHVLQRVAAVTNQGPKVYYRSPSFWRVSAAVNLPARINMLYNPGLNGFDARCVAYVYSLAVLSELRFPDADGALSMEFPENYDPRRDQ